MPMKQHCTEHTVHGQEMRTIVTDDYFQFTHEKACKSPLISSYSKEERLKSGFKARHRKYQSSLSFFSISPKIRKEMSVSGRWNASEKA